MHPHSYTDLMLSRLCEIFPDGFCHKTVSHRHKLEVVFHFLLSYFSPQKMTVNMAKKESETKVSDSHTCIRLYREH